MEEVMEKPILIAISKGSFLSQYVFDKNDNIPKALYKFFLSLGFDPDHFGLRYFLIGENYEKDGSGDRFISIEDVEDFRYNLKNDVYDVDFFIGHKKVFLVIRTKEDLQQEIVDKLFKVARMEDRK